MRIQPLPMAHHIHTPHAATQPAQRRCVTYPLMSIFFIFCLAETGRQRSRWHHHQRLAGPLRSAPFRFVPFRSVLIVPIQPASCHCQFWLPVFVTVRVCLSVCRLVCLFKCNIYFMDCCYIFSSTFGPKNTAYKFHVNFSLHGRNGDQLC